MILICFDKVDQSSLSQRRISLSIYLGRASPTVFHYGYVLRCDYRSFFWRHGALSLLPFLPKRKKSHCHTRRPRPGALRWTTRILCLRNAASQICRPMHGRESHFVTRPECVSILMAPGISACARTNLMWRPLFLGDNPSWHENLDARTLTSVGHSFHMIVQMPS